LCALKTCLDLLEAANDVEKARQQVKMLLAGLVDKIGVLIVAKGYRRALAWWSSGSRPGWSTGCSSPRTAPA
jgi:hypothetical protein